MTSTDVRTGSTVFDVLEMSESHWSARLGDREDGGPLPGDRSVGTDSLDFMLKPPPGLTGLNVTVTGHSDKAGRTIARFHGPGPGLDPGTDTFEEFTFGAPQLAVLGADAYDIDIDTASGIVTRWRALADGQPVSGAELHGLDTQAPSGQPDGAP
ncbi:hypothetical protein [Streptomyces sp. NPDC058486]|uniref:hypothetical protein n=1 Tax=unclassified Streptomyces TaxID=2593676 RepID=UPI0036497E80